jgi:hypothetical protein
MSTVNTVHITAPTSRQMKSASILATRSAALKSRYRVKRLARLTQKQVQGQAACKAHKKVLVAVVAPTGGVVVDQDSSVSNEDEY